MTEKQDFASRTFLKEDGTEVNANGVEVGSPEEQLQKFNDLESLRQRVRELIEERDRLQEEIDDDAGATDQNLLNELAQVKTERDGLKQQVEATAAAQAGAADQVAALQARIAELEGQVAAQGDGENAKPGDTDQRTKAELKTALDRKGVTYAPNTNRDGLLALAAEHQV
jgi:chromosome segregation ATPase